MKKIPFGIADTMLGLKDPIMPARRVGSVILAIVFGYGVTAMASPPPAARTVAVADDAFGLHLADPYRWMEGENNIEFNTWLKEQGAYGRAQLDAAPRLAVWRARLDVLTRGGTINRLQQPMGGRLFFLRLKEGQEGVLIVRDPDGRERVLLNPGMHSTGGLSAGITGFSPSPDGTRVAINVQQGGGEVTRITVLNVADAAALPDVIDEVWGEVWANWLPDGRGFTYTQLAAKSERDPMDPMLRQRVRLHRLGTPPDADPVLLASGTNSSVALEPNEFPFIDASQASDFALLLIGGARPQTRVCFAHRSEALRSNTHWNCPIGYDDNVQQVALHGRELALASMKGHPNGQVLNLELASRTTLHAARVVMPEDPGAVVTGFAAARDALYVRRMRGGPDEVSRIAYASGAPQTLALPYPGAAYLMNADPRAPGVVFTLQGWTQPRTAFLSTPDREFTDLKLGEDVSGDYAEVVAEETEAHSADGTSVPLTVIHRRDAHVPLHEIALLQGYGAYGISEQPYFDTFALEWVKAGHVYAVAHVRGGGEKGDRWRIEGSGQEKERGVEDFIACARELSARGWTVPARTVAWGGSMGGILVGGAITRDPAAFGAAAIQSGELNPSRLLAAKNGANQFAEVGDPRTADGLKSLAAMDPYQRLKPGTPYPAVLLIAGLNDNRVAPWNSGKFGARLMAVSTSGRSVWFRTDADMGHFPTAQGNRAREYADLFTFAEAAVGD